MNTAEAANELNHLSGVSQDYHLESELSDYAAEQGAEAERWERYGAREMYDTLLGGFND